MRKGHVEIICIFDKSGSMQKIRMESVENFNKFLAEQKEIPGSASVSLVFFSNAGDLDTVYENINLKSVDDLALELYNPDGGTALFDAIVSTINKTRDRHARMTDDEKPEKVMVCILTDGEENASVENQGEKGKETVKKLIDELTAEGWGFAFLGANMDAFLAGSTLGFSAHSTVSFVADSAGMAGASRGMSMMAASYRTGIKYSDDDLKCFSGCDVEEEKYKKFMARYKDKAK